MKLELDGLVDAIRQIDYGSRDVFAVVESMLVALASARAMVAELSDCYPGPNGVVHGANQLRLYKAAADLAGPLKDRAGVLKSLVDAVR